MSGPPLDRESPNPAAAGATLTVLICRGCCCGTVRKHRDDDHAAQVEALRRATDACGARLSVTECLGPCERSNVVVLRARDFSGTTTVWTGGVLGSGQTESLCMRIASFAGDRGQLTAIAGDLAFTPQDEAANDCPALLESD